MKKSVSALGLDRLGSCFQGKRYQRDLRLFTSTAESFCKCLEAFHVLVRWLKTGVCEHAKVRSVQGDLSLVGLRVACCCFGLLRCLDCVLSSVNRVWRLRVTIPQADSPSSVMIGTHRHAKIDFHMHSPLQVVMIHLGFQGVQGAQCFLECPIPQLQVRQLPL